MVTKKIVLAVVDGLGPELLDRALAAGRAPTIAALIDAGSRTDRCVSTFPSLTPVCLSALVTGEHPVGLAHSRDDLVPPRRGPVRRVRLLVRRDARRGDAADGRRHPRQPEPAPPLAARDDRVRGARGRRARHRGRQPVRVPRARPAPDHPARRPPLRAHDGDRRCGLRAAPVLPRRPLLLRPDRRAAQLRHRDRPPRRRRRPVARHPGRLRLPVPLPVRDRRRRPPRRRRDGCGRAGRHRPRAHGRGGRRARPVPGPVRRDRSSPTTPRARSSRSPTPRSPLADLRLFRSSRRSDPDRCDVAVAASNRAAMAYLLPGARIGPAEVADRLEALDGADVVALPRRGLARGAARRRPGVPRSAAARA